MRNYPVGRRLEGEDLWQQGPLRRGVFIPKGERLDDRLTALAKRANRRDARVNANDRLTQTLQSEVTSVLNQVGLTQLAAPPQSVAKSGPQTSLMRQATPGFFQEMAQLGLLSAYFLEEDAFLRTEERLGDTYHFVPDFDLSLPTVGSLRRDIKGDISPPDRGEMSWREQIGVDKAHRDGNTGRDIVVGALDTGVDADHSEFRYGGRYIRFGHVPLHTDQPILEKRGFDTDGHGTHVSGIVYGRKVGISPDAHFMMASVIESESIRTSFMRVVKGIEWVLERLRTDQLVENPAIVNFSLGFPPAVPDWMDPDTYSFSEQALSIAIRRLIQNDVLVVAAIGNDGPGRYRIPAAYPPVLSVGAVDYALNVAAFSGSASNGDDGKPDAVSFGVDVYSAFQRSVHGRSTYVELSGTSMASPHVAATAALTWARRPAMDSLELRSMLLDNAVPISTSDRSRVGAGLVRYVD